MEKSLGITPAICCGGGVLVSNNRTRLTRKHINGHNRGPIRNAKRNNIRLQQTAPLIKVTPLMRTLFDIPPDAQWLTADRKPLKIASRPKRKGLLLKVRGI